MRLFSTLAALLLVLSACDGGGADGTAPNDTDTPLPSGPSGSATPSPEVGEGSLVQCENPEGFTIEYPETWHTNSGKVVPRCSQFHREPFEVPRGTDERVAAITAYIDPVPFARASAPNERRDAEREELSIDDRSAVRLEFGAGPDSIWPEGTPITTYMIEMDPAPDDRERTLFIDTIGLELFDYESNQEILDRIAPSVEVTG